MPRGNSSNRKLVILLILIVLFGITAAIAGFAIIIPQQAYDIYGPSSPRLGSFQRLNYSMQLVLRADQLTHPVNPSGKERIFEISLGESVSSITNRLAGAGLISDPQAFKIFLIYSGLDTSLQAGEYQLSPAMTPVEIANHLQDATPQEVKYGVLPGWRIEEIAAALPTSGLSVSGEDFVNAAQNVQLVPGLVNELGNSTSLEGFLLPGVYKFRRDISAQEMVLSMVEQFNQQVTPKMREGFSKHGLSLYQAVTLASIVQREAVVEDEQPIIASVFFNRISEGMKLDSDPTVQYALGYNPVQKTWWTNPLNKQDLQVGSAYNTYLSPGLPPGPIDSPSIAALQAVAFPEQTPYFYFRARCDGSGRHKFAQTYDEHVRNACQ